VARSHKNHDGGLWLQTQTTVVKACLFELRLYFKP